ncbi:hypothetical protein [Paenibacillus woosongensis]|uniref:Uncharacterized protein n=1 Tax=Paenibacillus woosongensis TaxID=307580 RepID=A0A7X2Z2F0_9BACL|nr:hypothetical protein [Paenibacillus woosongensis]MUG46351.1 hypothetical protein [Paenibacillus woosongensis]GIP58616.1 hypothetical protein J15TS10_24300 [Paenibacillus woosongensis]
MLSIHDNKIISYEVDFQKSRITLHTIAGRRDSNITKIEFNEVLAHVFETQLRGSIILDINTLDVSLFLEHNKELLEKEKEKDYAWPIYYEKLEDLLEHLQHEKYNYYVISASYGLNGWVIAKEYKVYS